LVKHKYNVIDINLSALLAGVALTVFCTLCAVLLLLSFITWVNEKRQRRFEEHTNTFWQIIKSLLPSNTVELKHQRGVTRKILVLTCGFTVLLATTYYQSNLLQQLMLPKPLPKVKLVELLSDVRHFNAKIHMDSGMHEMVRLGNVTDILNAMAINKPIIDGEKANIMEQIVNERSILIEELAVIKQRLSRLPPSECANYVIVDVPEMIPYWMTIRLDRTRRDILERLNVIVAERMNFISELIDKNQMDEECRNHIYPPHIVEPRFIPLNMYKLSGAFVLLVSLCSVSVLVMLCEIVAAHVGCKSTNVKHPTIGARMDSFMAHKILHTVRADKHDDVLFHYRVFRDHVLLYQM
jgi:hypothetical protein